MSLIVAWLIFPIALVVITLGCARALERAAGIELPGVLLVPAGLAVVVAVTAVATAADTTAELATPLIVVLAAAGLAASLQRARRPLVDRATVAAAIAVFAVFAAPVVLSGEATFAGYIKLDDTSTFLALTDRVMEHGRSRAGLAPSTYEATLASNLNGYPVGSFLPLGFGARLLNQDPAWLWQPWLAFLAATLALTCNALLRPLVPGAGLRALCTFVAAQPALLFGYALWGGTKELATAWVVALAAALVPAAAATTRWRAALPLAVTTAATVAIVSLAGGIWIAPALAATVILGVRTHGVLPALRFTAALAGLAAVLGTPAIIVAGKFLSGFVGGATPLLTSESDIGNLFGRISELQVLGIWPSGDFRVDPVDLDAAHVLMAVAAVAAVAGLVAAVVRRAEALALYSIGTAVLGLGIAAGAGPWVAAKALAIASPAVLLAACAGIADGWQRGKRVEAVVIGAALTGGVLWSNALAYREATLAPRDQLVDLERIGHRVAGQGPTLMTEYNPYGARHFLRDADGEGVSELRRRVIPLRSGGHAAKGEAVDTDDVQLPALLEYRTIVVRRSPVASRPPAAYRLIRRGSTYDTWQRQTAFAAPREHLPLGGPLSAAAVPRCEDVRRLATVAGSGGTLATVPRRQPLVLELGRLEPLPGWGARRGTPAVVYPNGPGTLAAVVPVPVTEGYGLWLGGSAHARVTVTLDGGRVGDVRGVLNPAGAYLSLGTVRLRAGPHRIAITHHPGGWHPGVAAQDVLPVGIGPLVLVSAMDSRELERVPAARWRTLCTKSLDWIEALPPPG